MKKKTSYTITCLAKTTSGVPISILPYFLYIRTPGFMLGTLPSEAKIFLNSSPVDMVIYLSSGQ